MVVAMVVAMAMVVEELVAGRRRRSGVRAAVLLSEHGR
jgi:hypothetical protein